MHALGQDAHGGTAVLDDDVALFARQNPVDGLLHDDGQHHADALHGRIVLLPEMLHDVRHILFGAHFDAIEELLDALLVLGLPLLVQAALLK